MKIKILTLILLALWIPVTIDKLVDYDAFKSGILGQPFSDSLGYFLTIALPVLEVLTVLFLLLPSLRRYGIMLSFILMLAFTIYIGVALLGAWEKLPCGCGSVISTLTWKQHFFFNLFFLLISGYGFYETNLNRSGTVGGVTTEGLSA